RALSPASGRFSSSVESRRHSPASPFSSSGPLGPWPAAGARATSEISTAATRMTGLRRVRGGARVTQGRLPVPGRDGAAAALIGDEGGDYYRLWADSTLVFFPSPRSALGQVEDTPARAAQDEALVLQVLLHLQRDLGVAGGAVALLHLRQAVGAQRGDCPLVH